MDVLTGCFVLPSRCSYACWCTHAGAMPKKKQSLKAQKIAAIRAAAAAAGEVRNRSAEKRRQSSEQLKKLKRDNSGVSWH